MKQLKYVFLGALMLSVSAPIAAQEGQEAVEAVKQIISSGAPDMAKQVTAIYKKNKKNADVINGIGRAFFDAHDVENARFYAELGTKLKSSDSYILLGDIAALSDDGGAAASYYDQAIYFDETNAEAYRKYAIIYSRISFQSSIDKLEQLRAKVPGYPVDLPIARLYDNAGKIDDAIKHYEKVSLDQMEARDLAMFALKYNLVKEYDKSLNVVEQALKRFPRSSSLNRMGLMSTIAKEDFDGAMFYGDRLFNKSDSVELKDMDFVNYAKAYIGKGSYDEAIKLFRKGIEVSQADKDAVNNLRKEISDAYMKMGDFDNSVKEYRVYLDNTSSKTASDYSTLAEMYYKHAADLQGEEQLASIRQADDIYKDLQQRFANNPDVLAYVLNRRGTLNVIMDPDSKQGLAKPIFEQLMQMMEAKADRSSSDNSKLITCYRYLLSYDLLVKDNKAAAKEWAQKILTLDPENEQAKAVMAL